MPKVIFFQPYPFQVGQKIHITSGSRRGDWEVMAVGPEKIRLRCPVSGREVEWPIFCYVVEEKEVVSWPQHHGD